MRVRDADNGLYSARLVPSVDRSDPHLRAEAHENLEFMMELHSGEIDCNYLCLPGVDSILKQKEREVAASPAVPD